MKVSNTPETLGGKWSRLTFLQADRNAHDSAAWVNKRGPYFLISLAGHTAAASVLLPKGMQNWNYTQPLKACLCWPARLSRPSSGNKTAISCEEDLHLRPEGSLVCLKGRNNRFCRVCAGGGQLETQLAAQQHLFGHIYRGKCSLTESEVILEGGVSQRKRHQSTKSLCDTSHRPLMCQPGEETVKTGWDFIPAVGDAQISIPGRAAWSRRRDRMFWVYSQPCGREMLRVLAIPWHSGLIKASSKKKNRRGVRRYARRFGMKLMLIFYQ